jgi:hypothetical protein
MWNFSAEIFAADEPSLEEIRQESAPQQQASSNRFDRAGAVS